MCVFDGFGGSEKENNTCLMAMLATDRANVVEGDTVVLYFSYTSMRAVTVLGGSVTQCKEGTFDHYALIGAAYGSRVLGRPWRKAEPDNRPAVTVLRLTPELWSTCVLHRTQIIYMTDIAVVCQLLRLRPGMVVAEAGTGTGSLTHALARAVAPSGRVYTFDFHRYRAATARKEFAQNGVGDVVVAGWRDVCSVPGPGAPPPPMSLDDVVAMPRFDSADDVGTAAPSASSAAAAPPPPAEGDDADGRPPPSPALQAVMAAPVAHAPPGYGLPAHSVDAVFLDVPSPWLAVPNVHTVLKPGGVVCSFSPCIEQAQKFCSAIDTAGEYILVRTVEALTKEFKAVFPEKRQREEGGFAAQVKFKPQQLGKGHSAYLTFAQRRIAPAAGA